MGAGSTGRIADGARTMGAEELVVAGTVLTGTAGAGAGTGAGAMAEGVGWLAGMETGALICVVSAWTGAAGAGARWIMV